MSVTDQDTTGEEKVGFAADLLAWYDVNARVLPWRSPPGTSAPDPYRVWLSEIMLQQTTIATVRPRYDQFLDLFPTVEALATAETATVLGAWAGLGYYARARNLHACAKVVAESGWPRTEAGLRRLPGIGAYAATSIAAIAFGRRSVVVDANVERIVARVFAVETPVKRSVAAIRAGADRLTPDERPGDYAQAMMDLGATICRPREPDCLLCPVRRHCDAAARGLTAELPVRVPKKPRPIRRGTVYVGRRSDGAVLCERRASGGLYGGMAGLPGSEWGEARRPAAPFEADWREVGTVTHRLTHFVLELTVFSTVVETAPPSLFFVPPREVGTLPTLFRACIEVAD